MIQMVLKLEPLLTLLYIEMNHSFMRLRNHMSLNSDFSSDLINCAAQILQFGSSAVLF